ncbi:MAG: hypothetical protein HY983_01580 [Candidatus Magasanikbacteria bacterium]|nr:hypothetical protein [Candidatus Magasanikbacteria bacterium]
MKQFIEPTDGGLSGNMAERTPRLGQKYEDAEQPTDAGVIIERSLGQIKAEKEAIERQIRKLEKLVESPNDIKALENLQQRTDKLAEEYANKIAGLVGQEKEVVEEVDDSMIKELPTAPSGKKGQFQHFFNEAAEDKRHKLEATLKPEPEKVLENKISEVKTFPELIELIKKQGNDADSHNSVIVENELTAEILKDIYEEGQKNISALNLDDLIRDLPSLVLQTKVRELLRKQWQESERPVEERVAKGIQNFEEKIGRKIVTSPEEQERERLELKEETEKALSRVAVRRRDGQKESLLDIISAYEELAKISAEKAVEEQNDVWPEIYSTIAKVEPVETLEVALRVGKQEAFLLKQKITQLEREKKILEKQAATKKPEERGATPVNSNSLYENNLRSGTDIAGVKKQLEQVESEITEKQQELNALAKKVTPEDRKTYDSIRLYEDYAAEYPNETAPLPRRELVMTTKRQQDKLATDAFVALRQLPTSERPGAYEKLVAKNAKQEVKLTEKQLAELAQSLDIVTVSRSERAWSAADWKRSLTIEKGLAKNPRARNFIDDISDYLTELKSNGKNYNDNWVKEEIWFRLAELKDRNNLGIIPPVVEDALKHLWRNEPGKAETIINLLPGKKTERDDETYLKKAARGLLKIFGKKKPEKEDGKKVA